MSFKKAQQEMVGFVLIVMIVMIVGLVFFLISTKTSKSESSSPDLDNFLSSMLISTTDCAPVFVPDYNNILDLIKSCKEDSRCKNINKDPCDYLNETLDKLLKDYISSRSDISYYNLEITYNETEIVPVIPKLEYGICKGTIFGAYNKFGQGMVRLRICRED